MAHLPEEVLANICSYSRISATSKLDDLSDERLNLSTLAKLSLASKSLSRAARPHLYRTIDLQDDHYGTKSVVKRRDTAPLIRNLRPFIVSTQLFHRS